MNSKRVFLFVTLILAFANLIVCDANQLVDQIQAKTTAKEIIFNQKTDLLNTLSTQGDNVKTAYLNRLQAFQNSQSAYTNYFNQKIRCEGFDEQLDVIDIGSSLPSDYCPQAPVNPQAYNAFIKKLQLAYATGQVSYNQKIVDEQINFNADVYEELAAYTRLRSIAYGPLMKAVEAYQACMKANTSNCDALNAKITEKETIYGYYRGREVTFGMSTKTPVFTLEAKQRALVAAQESKANFTTDYNQASSQIKALKDACPSSLQAKLNDVNSNLNSALVGQNDIGVKVQAAQTTTVSLESLVSQTQTLTGGISTLATQLKALFP